jgi:hypothetical protein
MGVLIRRILLLAFAVAYFLSPIDIFPDYIVGPGWIDDLIVVVLVIWFMSGRWPPLFNRFGSLHGNGRRGYGRTASEDTSGRSARSDMGRGTSDDPYEVLGIRPGASLTEIKEAYKTAALKYHPDKVSHLGREFQELAHKRFVAIQEAYERLTRRP